MTSKCAPMQAAAEPAPVHAEAGRFRDYIDHFEHVARVNADACALSADGRALTYAALDRNSNQWAQALIERGCGPETLVAVCADHSFELVAALIGTLKSGAAFVPIDPQFAPERSRTIVQQARTPLIVCDPRYASIFDRCPAEVLWIGASAQHASTPRASRQAADPDNLAYIIYTSGSTGTPKGVAVTHRSFYQYVRWANEYYGFHPSGVSILHTSIAFDLTITSLFCPLIAGMTIALAPSEGGVDALLRTLDEGAQTVSLLKLTPSHLRLLSELKRADTATEWDCEVLIAGGEQLTAAAVQTCERWCPRTRIFNEYGPTEATVGCCVARVTAAGPLLDGTLPIGSAIPGVSLRLYESVPELGNEVQEGELFIGGDSLARGYLNAPALTAQSFVPDPKADGQRLYRSGDWVRRTGFGNELAFAGRRDRQVKVDGVRIEFEEVECALREHPSISDAAVTADFNQDGTATLIAFVCPSAPALRAPELSAITRHLRERVHASAVPKTFYVLDKLPLAASGKVDLQALARGRAAYPRLTDSYVAPRNAVEELLASLWCRILDREEIGIDDTFFGLDGNSMKSIQFVYEAKKRGFQLSTRDVFERQTIRELAELASVQRSTGAASGFTQPFSLITPKDRERLPSEAVDAYPLAMLQAGTLFESNIHLGSGTYHNVNSYYLDCDLNVGLVRSALAFVSARHPILRTCYDFVTYTEPLQIVYRTAEIPLHSIDIRHLAPAEQEKYLADFIHQESHTAFDWTKPPLLRFFIHWRGPRRFQFTLSKHHSILDGWSAATLITEIMKNYLALAKGQVAPFQSPVETTYRDYVALGRQAMASDESAAYWRDTLADAPYHEFRAWGKPAVNDGKPGSRTLTRAVTTSPALSALLKETATRAHAPLKSVLLAAHLRVLAQITGNDRVVTGVVSHGRPETAGADRALGLFINTVPYHIAIEERFTWFELIERVVEEERRVMPHQRYPMARMKKDSGRDRLFESVFYFTDFHVFRDFRDSPDLRCLDSAGFEETEIPLTTAFSRHPLTGEIWLRLHFHLAHFSEAQMTSISSYFERALEELAAAPHQRVLMAGLEPPTTHTFRPEESNGGIFSLFLEQVRAHPDATAFITAERHITCRSLLRVVERLGAAIANRGVTHGDIVGICVADVAAAIAAMLAVNRLHGCFVILDPEWPDLRLDDVLRQIEPAVIIADSAHASRISSLSTRVLNLEHGLPEPLSCQHSPGDPEELAYIVFTSGSTGKPKGVMVSNRNLYCSTMSRLRYYKGRDTRFLLLSRLTFDSAFAGIWGTLCSGGTLLLPGHDGMMDVGTIASIIREQCATGFLAIPALYRVLLPELASSPALCLDTVILAGEEVTRDLVRAHGALLPGVDLYNEYGPSEVTIWATVAKLDSSAADELRGGVSIGKAVEHVDALVLDSGMRPVSPGAAGELYLGGPAVSRGYYQAPALTVERFVPNRFSRASSGSVFYRTGDLVRQRPDGELEFIRRVDNQVKVRGFRIEVEEIERVFYDSFPVRDAMVAVRDDASGTKKICLYYVPLERDGRDAELVPTREARKALMQRLPSHMLPDEVVEAESLPRLPNNKLDRSAAPKLRAKVVERPAERNGKPSTEIERAIAGIWCEALNLPEVGVHESFFEMGGDSLLANRIILKTAKIFGVTLFVKEFYDDPTVAGHGHFIQQKGRESGLDFERIASIWNQTA